MKATIKLYLLIRIEIASRFYQYDPLFLNIAILYNNYKQGHLMLPEFQSLQVQRTMSIHENIRLPAERTQLAAIRRFIVQHAGTTCASPEEVQDLVLATDEAATNIIVHGYRDGRGDIDVELVLAPDRITVILRDQAPPFDPTKVPEPDLELPLFERPVGGLGVHIIRQCVDEFTHAIRANGGNELRMVKYLKNNGGPE